MGYTQLRWIRMDGKNQRTDGDLKEWMGGGCGFDEAWLHGTNGILGYVDGG